MNNDIHEAIWRAYKLSHCREATSNQVLDALQNAYWLVLDEIQDDDDE